MNELNWNKILYDRSQNYQTYRYRQIYSIGSISP